MQISKETKITKVKVGQSNGTSEILTDAVDMANFEGVFFVGSIATAAADNIATVQQGDLSDGSYAVPLDGTDVSPGDNGDSFAIDVYRPTKRYVKLSIARGTSTVTGDVYAIQYSPRIHPIPAQGSTIDMESHVSPDETDDAPSPTTTTAAPTTTTTTTTTTSTTTTP
jgi:hypothetical protein